MKQETEIITHGPQDGSHLTLEDRKSIEKGIRNGAAKTAIAQTIGKDNSTVGKEISGHRELRYKCALPLECANYKKCKFDRLCKTDCKGYKPFVCKRRDRSPGACNGCQNYSKCRFSKYYYDADKANYDYHERLVDSRSGINLSYNEAKDIANTIRPLLEQGQSPYAILQACPNLDLSERTLYNYIENDCFHEFGITNMSLRCQVSRKLSKKKSAGYKKRNDNSYMIGRTYNDYQAFIKNNPSASIVQMDTVYNSGSGPFIQTFDFIAFGFLFAILHKSKLASDMYNGVLALEKIIGEEAFSKHVQAILTDRGSEFSLPDAMEKRSDGSLRTRVYFCDPMQSAQKGAIENKHIELRFILPKENDLYALGLRSQDKLNIVLSHLNSYPAQSLHGKSPFDTMKFFAPSLFQRFLDFGLKVIPTDKVTLKPYILNTTK